MHDRTSQRLTLAGLGLVLLAASARGQGASVARLGGDDALEALLPQPTLVAQARIGDRLGLDQKELKLGPSLAAPAQSAHLGWKKGAKVPFRLTYDGFGHASFSVAGSALGFDCAGPFEALGLRGYARRAGTSVRVAGLSLNTTALPLSIDASGQPWVEGLDVLLVQLDWPHAGFVLKGDLELSWTGVAPQGSDLALELRAGRLAPLGREYCPTTSNSSGATCRLAWSGTTSLSAANLGLHATGGIPGGYGLFLAGASAQGLPFGNGWLCVGPPLARFEPPLAFDAGGALSLAVDYGVEPLGSGPLAVLPGDVRYVQLWYRDPLGLPSSYNFSNALELTFVP